MNTRILPLAIVALAASAYGQTRTFDLPTTNPVPRTNNYPFAGPVQRYQQWYSAAEVLQGALRPCRIQGIQFKTTRAGQPGSQLDLEITLAHGPGFPAQNMQSNMFKDRNVVVPRRKITLPASRAGQFTFQINFAPREFIWDGKSALMLDVKLFSNGKAGNKPFLYDFESTVASAGKITRLYGLGTDPRSITSSSVYQPGWGLTTRFVAVDGVTVSVGGGCLGSGQVLPVASTTGGHPLPGNTNWTQVLEKARSQATAALLIGASDKTWGPIKLPFELTPVGGSGCFLLNDVVISMTKKTVGGGFGKGTASIPVPIPPVTIFFGQSVYTQWLIWDSGAPNGVLALSNGLRSIFG